MPEHRPGGVRRGFSWLVGLAALAAVVVVATHVSEPRELVRLVERAEPWWIAVALVLQAVTYVALAQVWRSVAQREQISLPLGRTVELALGKLFVDQTLPSGGISGGVLVATTLERRGLPHALVAATVIIELSSYYFAYALGLATALAITVLARHATPLVIVPAVVFIVVAVAIALGALRFSRVHRAPRVPGVRRLAHWAIGADRRLTGDVRLLARATAWQLAIVALDGTTTWTLLRATGVHAPLAAVFATFMIASLARTISIMPAGLGVFEGVGIIMLHELGISLAAALSAMLMFRGLSYWLPMIPGFIAVRRLRRERASPAPRST